MTHLFSFLGEYFAYDSESGALHQLDEAAFSLLQAYQDNDEKRPADPGSFVPWLDESEKLELIAEIEELIDNEELFSSGKEIKLEQLYPDGTAVKAMCLNICHACDLRCKYCFAQEGSYGDSHASMMSFATGKKAIDFLISASGKRRNLDIDFFGGEPLLNWETVEKLVSYCQSQGRKGKKDIRLTITTNATGLNLEKMKYLDRNFKNIVLSLDGRPEVHDRMRVNARGEGSYDLVAPKIKEFVRLREDREYYIRGTFTKYNLDFSEDALHLAKFGKNISLEPVLSAPGTSYGIEPSDLPQIEKEYEKLALAIDQLAQQGQEINFFHFFVDLDSGPCLFKRLKGCGVGLEYIAVAPSGDIYPCHQLVGEKQYLLGSVHDGPVQLDSKIQNLLQRFLLSDQDSCLDCWARYHCGGGCAADILHSNNSLAGINEISCRLLKKRIEAALWLAYRRKIRN